jgi:hypothetical protein
MVTALASGFASVGGPLCLFGCCVVWVPVLPRMDGCRNKELEGTAATGTGRGHLHGPELEAVACPPPQPPPPLAPMSSEGVDGPVGGGGAAAASGSARGSKSVQRGALPIDVAAFLDSQAERLNTTLVFIVNSGRVPPGAGCSSKPWVCVCWGGGGLTD